jgi:peptide-methionine (S)-S-oxide reductase
MSFLRRKTEMVTAESALQGHEAYVFSVPSTHFINAHRIREPFDQDGLHTAVFGMGCFWGAEKLFWETPGVWSTAVGYAGGFTEYPTYEEVCAGVTGHTEAVRVIYDPRQVSYAQLLTVFFEGHDPSQGMRQGNDVGTQYRSAIYYTEESQHEQAVAAAEAFSERLVAAGHGRVTTEIAPIGEFYYAEGHHQQYLGKNPAGYCGLGGTGISLSDEWQANCPTGIPLDR